ncbi:hypothetical protein GF366_00775, partial [Candidatus Peregrinibacteria bacterium]|nr:hypothetical protein [Candidatus Peregrinibacteria bacterium]
FNALREYKKENPHIFIIAPHPYFYGFSPLKEKFEGNIDVFDAIEHSWFYTKIFNRNKKAQKMAKKYDLPLISTSDTHFLDFLNTDYAIIKAEEKTKDAIFEAVKKKRLENVTRPKVFFREFLWKQGVFTFWDTLKKIFK